MAKKVRPKADISYEQADKLTRLPAIGWLVTQLRNNTKRYSTYIAAGALLIVAMPIFNVNTIVSLPFILIGTLLIVIHGLNLLFERQLMSKLLGKAGRSTAYQRKYPEADLERLRKLLLRTGFALTLFLIILAFNWKMYDREAFLQGNLAIPDEMEIEPPQTKQEKKPPPPPIVEIEEVEDDEILEDEPEIEDTEAFEDMEITAPEEETSDEPEIFTIVEDNPEFPGGQEKMYEYIYNNLNYPRMAIQNDIEGQVVARFVVRSDGSISDIQIVRDIGGGCGKEVERILKSMPTWKPGKQRGKPVNVYFTLPVRFSLE